MIKEQIPIKSVVDLLGQLYALAKEYPRFSGYAACHDADADIRATVGNGMDKTTFVFVNDDPGVMKLLVQGLHDRHCLVGDSIDAHALIRRVERDKAGGRRMKAVLSGTIRMVLGVALAGATALFFCSSVLGNLTDRVSKLESEIKMLQQQRTTGTLPPASAPQAARPATPVAPP